MPKQKSPDRSGKMALLVGTRKGGFLLRTSRARDKWKLEGPFFLGSIIHHLILDPRDGRTLLMAASAGHLGPTIFRSTDQGHTWEEASQPPAFLCTADEAPLVEQPARAAGFNGCWAKPVPLQDVMAALARCRPASA